MNPLWLTLPLLIIEGIFSGSEIALLSADTLALKTQIRRGSRRAKLAFDLARRPEKVLSTTLVVTTICVIGISVLVTLHLRTAGYQNPDLLAVLITSPMIVIFWELIPKTIYQHYCTRLAPWVAYPVMLVYWLFYPITRLISSYTTRLSRIVGPIEEQMTGRQRTTRESLRAVLSAGREETGLKSSEKKMIRRILDFSDTEARKALIPLLQVDAIPDAASVREALEIFQSHRHSRMPVFKDRVDNIVGVLEAMDLVRVENLELPIRNFVTTPQYVPETQGLRWVLEAMNQEDNQMAIVVDEYGGAVGILTFEDVIEEIVGEIQDEYDSDSDSGLHLELAPGKWLIQSKMDVSAINELLKIDIPTGNYETLSGFLLQQFGRIPEARDELLYRNLRFTIKKADDRKIESAIIERVGDSGIHSSDT